MERLIQHFTNRRTWAVVGVSNDNSKFGNKIYKDLKGAGYNVFGVNPKGGLIGSDTLYPTLKSLEGKVKFSDLVVDLVVPPKVTEEVVKSCKDLGIKSVWMQPGSESPMAIEYCNSNGIDVVHDSCAMIKKKTWPEDI
eukprot:TRINITY_DN11082_c0_g1_i2.p1 TRINITY_DN11082_c0_g1~~TRINITY_DN11082_c0_g1_i2.p1  ORF type:complete len:138 (+),score=15.96 TRINITY_DN11082_c0_g1_i2:55-468(+)